MRIRDAFVLIVGSALGFAAYRSITPRLNTAFRPLGLTYDVVMGAVIGVFSRAASISPGRLAVTIRPRPRTRGTGCSGWGSPLS
jgi:hypothetical protein